MATYFVYSFLLYSFFVVTFILRNSTKRGRLSDPGDHKGGKPWSCARNKGYPKGHLATQQKIIHKLYWPFFVGSEAAPWVTLSFVQTPCRAGLLSLSGLLDEAEYEAENGLINKALLKELWPRGGHLKENGALDALTSCGTQNGFMHFKCYFKTKPWQGFGP